MSERLPTLEVWAVEGANGKPAFLPLVDGCSLSRDGFRVEFETWAEAEDYLNRRFPGCA